MRSTLEESAKDKHADCTIEVSNAGAEYTAIARKHGVSIENINKADKDKLRSVGEAIVRKITSKYHDAVAKSGAGYEKDSIMLHLAWSKPKKRPKKEANYEVFVYDKHIACEEELQLIKWSARMGVKKGELTATLVGKRPNLNKSGHERAIEIYLYSGGHVKYYPRVEDAIWRSGTFTLLQAPRQTHVLSAKAHGYWPEEWKAAGGEIPDNKLMYGISEAASN